jgi:hypothetical protein
MASTNIGVFDIDELFVLFGGKRIIGWPTSGTIISVTKIRPDEVTAEEGVDGELAVYKTKSKLYRADITVMRTSAANGYLWDLLQVQRNAPGIPFLPFAVTYEENKMLAARACVASHPPMEHGADAMPNSTWGLLLLNYDGLFRGISVDGATFTTI